MGAGDDCKRCCGSGRFLVRGVDHGACFACEGSGITPNFGCCWQSAWRKQLANSYRAADLSGAARQRTTPTRTPAAPRETPRIDWSEMGPTSHGAGHGPRVPATFVAENGDWPAGTPVWAWTSSTEGEGKEWWYIVPRDSRVSGYRREHRDALRSLIAREEVQTVRRAR